MDEAGRSSVIVENVTLSDAGTYVCVAENSVGAIRALSFVRVRGEALLFTSFSPLVILILASPPVLWILRAAGIERRGPHLPDCHPGGLHQAGLSGPRRPQPGDPLAPKWKPRSAATPNSKPPQRIFGHLRHHRKSNYPFSKPTFGGHGITGMILSWIDPICV